MRAGAAGTHSGTQAGKQVVGDRVCFHCGRLFTALQQAKRHTFTAGPVSVSFWYCRDVRGCLTRMPKTFKTLKEYPE